MQKYGAYFLFGGGLLFAIVLVSASFAVDKKDITNNTAVQTGARTEKKQVIKQADKIQVFLFHTTNRCYSCITIGQLAKKTVEEKFAEELRSGKVEFREINIDLPENKDLAGKFKASGSSLFLNPIIDGADNIEEDTKVWRLISDEEAFVGYLSDKLKAWL